MLPVRAMRSERVSARIRETCKRALEARRSSKAGLAPRYSPLAPIGQPHGPEARPAHPKGAPTARLKVSRMRTMARYVRRYHA